MLEEEECGLRMEERWQCAQDEERVTIETTVRGDVKRVKTALRPASFPKTQSTVLAIHGVGEGNQKSWTGADIKAIAETQKAAREGP